MVLRDSQLFGLPSVAHACLVHWEKTEGQLTLILDVQHVLGQSFERPCSLLAKYKAHILDRP